MGPALCVRGLVQAPGTGHRLDRNRAALSHLQGPWHSGQGSANKGGRELGPCDVPPGSEVRTWVSCVHQITSNLSGTPDSLKKANILHKKEEKLLK